jgi:DnaJ-class molecular chaperone
LIQFAKLIEIIHNQEEQISKEYKIRALQLHPDKCDGHESLEFQNLQKARETLLNAKRRSMYDRWMNSGLAIDFDQFAARFHDNWSGFHWINHRSDPMIAFKGKSDQTNQSTSNSKPLEWSSDTSNDLIHKFRNYEI